MEINITFLLYLVVIVIALILTVLVLTKKPREKVNKIFSVLVFSTVVWIICNYLTDSSTSVSSALFWAKMSLIGPIIVAPALLHFSFIFPTIKYYPSNILKITWGVALLHLFFIPTQYNVQSVVIRDWGIEFTPGILYSSFGIMFLVYLGWSIFNLVNRYIKASALEKTQLRYVLLGFSITAIIAFIFGLFLPLLGYSRWAIIAPVSTLILFTSTTYSIIKFRFLDIRLAIRAASVRIIYTAFIFFISIATVFFYSTFSEIEVLPEVYIVVLILAFLISFTGDRILNFIQRSTDKIFFQRNYTEQEILSELSRTMAQSIDLPSLTKKIEESLLEVFHVQYASIIIFGDNGEVSLEGGRVPKRVLDSENELIRKIREVPQVMILDELKIINRDNYRKEADHIIQEMNNIEAQVVVPLHGNEDVIGLIILGEKKSNEAFSTNDVKVLETLSYQAGIAVENAHLYTEVKSFSRKLQEEVKSATADLKEKNRFLGILRGLDQIIMNTLDVDRMCQKVVDNISWEMGMEGGMILLLDEAHYNLRVMAISQTPTFEKFRSVLPHNLKTLNISLTEKNNPLVEAITDSKVSLVTRRDGLYAKIFGEDLAKKINAISTIKTSVVYPLSAKGKKLGVIVFGLGTQVKSLSSKEQDLFQAFVDQTGIAIENAQLYSDITQANKKLERANEHLKELDKMKDEFVSIASHELRTPMTAIQGYAWMLKKGKHKAALDVRQVDYLDKIIVSTDRLISLVSDMLDVSRIQGGRIKLDMKKEQITDIIWSTIEEVKPKSLEKNIILTYEEPKKELPLVDIDEKKIREVLLNFIGNALKFTPQAGKITVHAQKKGKFVQVSVTDTGKGIAKEDISKLFKKFSRLEHSFAMVSETSGTGLGLYISKAFIELHGGKVGVTSKINKGSTFYFTVRIAK